VSGIVYFFVVAPLVLVGLVAGLGFLLTHRPKQWRSIASLDATGWVLIATLLFARSAIQLAVTFPGVHHTAASAVAGIVSCLVVDVLLVLRLFAFRRFIKQSKGHE
jgi:hypothetical protein